MIHKQQTQSKLQGFSRNLLLEARVKALASGSSRSGALGFHKQQTQDKLSPELAKVAELLMMSAY